MNVTWPAISGAEYYLVVWANNAIVECTVEYPASCAFDPNSTDTANKRNWWAANPAATSSNSININVGTTNPVFVAVFSFDSADNMSKISQVVQASAGQATTPDTPTGLAVE